MLIETRLPLFNPIWHEDGIMLGILRVNSGISRLSTVLADSKSRSDQVER